MPFQLVRIFLVIFISVFIGLAGCGGGGGGTPEKPVEPTPPTPVTVYGTIKEQNDTETASTDLVQVQVTSQGKTTYSNAQGLYSIELNYPADGELIVQYEKDGFAPTTKRVQLENNSPLALNARLLKYQLVQQLDPTKEQVVEVFDANSAITPAIKLNFPVGTFNTVNPVIANVALADPNTERGLAVFPGDYLAAQTPTGPADTFLESISFADITVTDEVTGQEITTLNNPADISIKLPPVYQTGGTRFGEYSDGSEIELWSFNETRGIWVREDADPGTVPVDNAAVVNIGGELYANAKVTHFSWWNLDRPVTTHACMCVTVVDDLGGALPNEIVMAQGVNYSGTSSDLTDANGQACVTVMRSSPGSKTVDLYVDRGNARFNHPGNTLTTPSQEGTTIYGTDDNCVNSGTITIDYNGTITGTVVNEAGDPLANRTVYTTLGSSTTTQADGSFTVNAPTGQALTVYTTGALGVAIPTDWGPTYNGVNLVVTNQQPVISDILRSVSGRLANGVSIDLTAQVFDFEGDSISYSWEVLSGEPGTLNPVNTATATWTAPAAGAGFTILRITVDDGNAHPVSRDITIYWGDLTANLSFIISNKSDNTLLDGVTVVLHTPDNIGVEASRITDVNGIANFNDVGRETVSITLVYDPGTAYKAVYSFMDVPVGENIELKLQDTVFQPNEFLNINYDISNIPDATNYKNLSSYPDNISIGQTFIDNTITNSWAHRTSNFINGNLFTPLVFARNFNTGELYGYGFAEDHDVTNTTIPIDMAGNTLTTVNFSENSNSLVTIYGHAIRQGVLYKDIMAATQTNVDVEIPLLIPGDFPADYFHIYATDDFGDTFVRRNFISPLPGTTVPLAFPDYTFNANYTTGTGTLDWTVGGTSNKDIIILQTTMNTASGTVYWDVHTSGNVTSWTIPDLPSPYDTLVDRAVLGTGTLGNEFYVYMTAYDYTNWASIADFWLTLGNGFTLDEMKFIEDNVSRTHSNSFSWGAGGGA